ncbi:hypothetical protein LINPERHAP2_LOCUS35083 [Linum perenne]
MDNMTSISQLRAKGEWMRIWRMNLPPKMKHVLWRAMREVLPTKEVLQHRGVAVPWSCGVCGGNPENTWHLFVDCEFARDCWKERGYEEIIDRYRMNSESFVEWAADIVKESEEAVLARIAAIMWAIWRERNAQLCRQESLPAGMVVMEAKEAVEEWRHAQETRSMRFGVIDNTECTKWHLLPEGVLIQTQPCSNSRGVQGLGCA